MSIQQHFKHGIGRLTAAAEGLCPMTAHRTRLTQVSHKAPMRWVPVWKSSVEKAGAAVCTLSNYGGGMLQGDSTEVHVHVKENARLGVTTQGVSRIYTQRTPNLCRATLDAKVDPRGMLVWAPDPCSLFRKSSFEQVQRFTIHPTSSVALIDWFSSGRYRNGEHWVFDQLSSRTSLSFEGEDTPFLQDAVHLDLTTAAGDGDGSDPLGVSEFHAFASLILYGDQMEAVRLRCEEISDALMLQRTRIRERAASGVSHSTPLDVSLLGLAGKVCMGISEVETSLGVPSSAHVVRLAATTNEDLHRIFHQCLLPLAPQFGLSFYGDRIRAKASEIPKMSPSATAIDKQATVLSILEPAKVNSNVEKVDLSQATVKMSGMWSAYMLADSALPTGSFAHSAGLEVAGQLGYVSDIRKLENFIQAAARSTVQMTAPFLEKGHELATNMESGTGSSLERWQRLHRQCQAALAPNAPACAASLDQGKSLARIAGHWLDVTDPSNKELIGYFQDGNHHLGPVLGALGARLGMSMDQVVHLFGYCSARDIVSAALRLSLVGPLASVKTLDKVQAAANDGWLVYQKLRSRYQDEKDAQDIDPLVLAAASAPVVEAMHPCHKLLQVRLFRS